MFDAEPILNLIQEPDVRRNAQPWPRATPWNPALYRSDAMGRDLRILNQVQDDVSGFSDPVNRAQTARNDPKAPQSGLPPYFQASARPWVKVK